MTITAASPAIYTAPTATPAPAPAPAPAAAAPAAAPAAEKPAAPAAPVSYPAPAEVARVTAGQGETSQLQATYESKPTAVQSRVDNLLAAEAQRDRTDAIWEKAIDLAGKALSSEDLKSVKAEAETAFAQWQQNHGHATPTVEGEMASIFMARKLNDMAMVRGGFGPEGSDLKKLQQATQDYMDGRMPLVQQEERSPGMFQAMDQREETNRVYNAIWNKDNLSDSLMGMAFETGLFTGGEYNLLADAAQQRVRGVLQAGGGLDPANQAELPTLAFMDALGDRAFAKLDSPGLTADQAQVAEALVEFSQRYLDKRTEYLKFVNS